MAKGRVANHNDGGRQNYSFKNLCSLLRLANANNKYLNPANSTTGIRVVCHDEKRHRLYVRTPMYTPHRRQSTSHEWGFIKAKALEKAKSGGPFITLQTNPDKLLINAALTMLAKAQALTARLPCLVSPRRYYCASTSVRRISKFIVELPYPYPLAMCCSGWASHFCRSSEGQRMRCSNVSRAGAVLYDGEESRTSSYSFVCE
jgi:hypothetical protein